MRLEEFTIEEMQRDLADTQKEIDESRIILNALKARTFDLQSQKLRMDIWYYEAMVSEREDFMVKLNKLYEEKIGLLTT